MCTLSLFKTSDGYRVFMNRDERHDRTPEKPPQILDERNGVYGPLDPVSAGTWIAYNKCGFWACLLNGYFEAKDHEPAVNTKSRGTIIKDILVQDDPFQAAHALDASQFQSFRLVIGNAQSHKLYVWDGKSYGAENFHACENEEAYFLTSSSWNQGEVIKTRMELFQSWYQGDQQWDRKGVPTFHTSQFPNPEAAPLMHRSYSRTKSITALDITVSNVEMSYTSIEGTNAA